MTIQTMPTRPTALPVASPRACDTALLKALMRDRSACVGWASALEPRCRMIQLRATRGIWQSERELRQMQRQATAILRVSHAHRREIDRADLWLFDAIAAFLAGVDMTARATVAA